MSIELKAVLLATMVFVVVVGGAMLLVTLGDRAVERTCREGGYDVQIYMDHAYFCVRTVDGQVQYVPLAVVEYELKQRGD